MRGLIAVRNTALYETDFDAGARIVQQRHVVDRALGQTDIQVHIETREYFPIPFGDGLANLISAAGDDRNFEGGAGGSPASGIVAYNRPHRIRSSKPLGSDLPKTADVRNSLHTTICGPPPAIASSKHICIVGA